MSDVRRPEGPGTKRVTYGDLRQPRVVGVALDLRWVLLRSCRGLSRRRVVVGPWVMQTPPARGAGVDHHVGIDGD